MAEAETDNLLADVLAADAELSGEKPEVIETKEAPVETAQEKADRVRDEQGRFAKAEEGKPRETLKLKGGKEAPAEDAKPGSEGSTPQAPVADVTTGAAPKVEGLEIPPVYWKGEAKLSWGRLPPPVRAEIVAQHERVAAIEAQYAPVEQAIAPHRDGWVRIAGSVESAITQLAQFHQLYLDNPRALIDHIARTRGIDLGQPAGQHGQTPSTPQTPDINTVVQQAVQQAIAPIQDRFKQTETQQVESTIAAFAADPKYPYFQDVKVHMGQLIKAGLATDMPDAYDKAVKLNPAIWSTLEAQKAEEAKNQQAADADKARKAAAASLRGSPLPGGSSPGTTGQGSTVLDDVRAAAAELAGA